MSKPRKTPPHPRSYGTDHKGRGAQLVGKAWRKWGKADAWDQAHEHLDGGKDPLTHLELEPLRVISICGDNFFDETV